MTDPTVIDLDWLGGRGRIGAWRVGDVLIDCGPHTTLDALLAAIGDDRPSALLLTHIHFDHAGAAGALVERWPGLDVFVHRRGARHLASPERLEASARRVFGEDFDRRFGPLTPIPETNIHALDGGERVHGLDVLYTPGHAVHHVAFLDDSGRAFPGDVAGVVLGGDGPVLPPTPPPDVDVDAWLASLAALRERAPTWLGLPHYGAHEDADARLAEAEDAVRRHAALSERSQDEYVAAYAEDLAVTGPVLDDYRLVVPPVQNHVGLRRWHDAQTRS